MIDSVLYSHNNYLQKNDAYYVIDNYFKVLKWSSNERILDVGTGDGSVLFDLVLPEIPPNFQKLVVLDIDEEMLNVVGRKCKKHPRIELLQMDIATTLLPKGLRSDFDHIFSFYCLQLVKEQRQAIQNLFDMLKPGGEMLLSIVANHLVFDVYEKLSGFKKWQPFMANFSDVGSYNRSTDAVQKVEGILQDAGFVKYKCEIVNTNHTHDFADFWLWASAINPFIKKIPEGLQEHYKQDYMKEVREHPKVTIEMKDGRQDKIRVEYKFLVVFACKPSF